MVVGCQYWYFRSHYHGSKWAQRWAFGNDEQDDVEEWNRSRRTMEVCWVPRKISLSYGTIHRGFGFPDWWGGVVESCRKWGFSSPMLLWNMVMWFITGCTWAWSQIYVGCPYEIPSASARRWRGECYRSEGRWDTWANATALLAVETLETLKGGARVFLLSSWNRTKCAAVCVCNVQIIIREIVASIFPI